MLVSGTTVSAWSALVHHREWGLSCFGGRELGFRAVSPCPLQRLGGGNGKEKGKVLPCPGAALRSCRWMLQHSFLLEWYQLYPKNDLAESFRNFSMGRYESLVSGRSGKRDACTHLSKHPPAVCTVSRCKVLWDCDKKTLSNMCLKYT